MPKQSKSSPIAIVGLSALFPGSNTAQGFWRDIVTGKDLISDIPPTRWLIEDHYDPDPKAPDKTYAKRGSFLGDIGFDPMEFGVPPSAINATDTCQLLALIVAKRVLDDALNSQFTEVARERASVILGVTSGQELFLEVASRMQRPVWVKALRESGIPEDQVTVICDRISNSYVPWQENTFPGLLGNVVAGRIANRFNLGGTNCVTDAACASSLSALRMGVSELEMGHSDLVITGGADTFNDISMYVCFSKTPALSPTGDCRPFSSKGDGTVLGEGMAMFAMKRLEDAERDGNHVYAVIRSVGSSSDGRSKSIYAPVAEGQAKAIRRTYEGAGYGPETVELVEAHGTGTVAGDAAEFGGLNMVFREADADKKQWCALGSVKSQIGHCKAAAGSASLFKTVLALHHKVFPPTLKIEQPNPKLNISETPFYLNTQARPWVRGNDHPRRASMSSFGFGGTNFHVALEEYTGPAAKPARWWQSPSELVLLAADSKAALISACRTLATKKLPLSHLALESQLSFNASKPERLAIVADSSADLVQRLNKAAESGLAAAPGTYYTSGSQQGKLAFLFPGQGSQYPGMTADVAMTFDEALHVWDQGAQFAPVVFPPPAFTTEENESQFRQLTQTENAQPAIGAASAALLAVLTKLGLKPDATGGHSFGEITALYASGGITLKALLEIARKRGELMSVASSVPAGMLSVRKDAATVQQLLTEWASPVVVANLNSPQQTVVSGAAEAIADAERRFTAAGLSVVRLPVSTAFHSPLVDSVVPGFKEFLAAEPMAAPAIPCYSNRDGQLHPASADELRTRIAEQIAKPVYFQTMVERMYEDGVRTFVEVGPGGILTSLTKSILGDKAHSAINLDRPGRHGLVSLWQGLGQLAVLGIPMDWAALRAGHVLEPFERPEDQSKFLITINGGNYGRPYPPAGGAAALPKPLKKAPVAITGPVVTPAHIVSKPEPTKPIMAAAPIAATADSLSAYQVFQESISAAHHSWQATFAKGHEGYLKAMESAYQSTIGGVVPVVPVFQPVAQPVAMAVPVNVPAPVPVVRPVAVVERPAAVSAPKPTANIDKLLLALIADKTGYPEEMLEPSMALEADLGIDSIKRVEIFSALQEKLPNLPEMDQTEMARLRTIGDIIAHLGVSPAPVVAAVVPSAVRSAPSADIRPILIALIAEKTGYPEEMLEPGMALEADLGIDSIKRVEIFSALQEKLPGIPEMDQTQIASLRTIGDIIAHLGESPAAVAVVPSGVSSAPSADIRPILIALIAEKTGYPEEMLEPGMALEADLGIDSIKRVEIFSALQEKLPGIPEMDQTQIASLRTIGDIIAHLGESPAAVVPSGISSAPSVDIRPILIALIAEKTGYPEEMLEPAMSLEADLGIDSIKRVEIFSALQEKLPGIPEMDQTQIASLRTIGDIIAHLNGASPEPVSAVSMPAVTKIESPRFAVSTRRVDRLGHVTLDKTDGPVAILGAEAVGKAIGKILTKKGYQIEPAIDDNTGAVICLAGLENFADIQAAMAANQTAFEAAKSVAARFAKHGGVFVTVQDTGGDFSSPKGWNAWAGGLTGLAKTASLEWPKARVKAIDIDVAKRTPREVAEAIVEELLKGGPEPEVGLTSANQRLVLEATQAETSGPALNVDSSSVVVATGGARGVTAVSLIRLAQTAKPKIVLLGRTALEKEPRFCQGANDQTALRRAFLNDAQTQGVKLDPAKVSAKAAQVLATREIQTTIAAMEQAGSVVKYLAIDARNAKELSSALDAVRKEWGPITGLVHGAGVLADKRLEDLTVTQFQSVFSTKVEGLAALLEATSKDPLTFIVMFSSIAARTGNIGQTAYSMANEVLNRVACAESVRRANCVVKSLNWGPWDGGMVTAGLRKHFEDQGIRLVGLEEGANLFTDEILNGGTKPVEVVLGGLPKLPNRELRIRIDQHSHPFLADHTIQDMPVLPTVEALEFFLRCARAQGNQSGPLVCTGLKVLRGVKLDQFTTGGNLFFVRPKTDTLFELVSPDGTRHYEATITAGPADSPAKMSQFELKEFPWPEADIYGKLLFHGPAFQVIRKVEGVSAEGIAGTLTGSLDRNWVDGHRHSDAAMLDGGLQLARLWGYHSLGKPTLPTSIGSLWIKNPGCDINPVRCLVSAHAVGSNKIVCDIGFVGMGNELVATMTGVEMHATAGA